MNPTPNEQADEELKQVRAKVINIVDGYAMATLEDRDRDIEATADEIMLAIAQHTKAAERLARIEELEEVKKYFPEYAPASTARLLLCVNNRIVVLEAELAAAQKDTK